MNNIINRLTLNHEKELRRSHISILYSLCKQKIFEIYRLFYNKTIERNDYLFLEQ